MMAVQHMCLASIGGWRKVPWPWQADSWPGLLASKAGAPTCGVGAARKHNAVVGWVAGG